MVFTCRSNQPLTDDILSSVSLFLELMRVLLSCPVIGRVDTHSPSSQNTNGSDSKIVHNFESKTLSFPKPFVKALVTNKDGADLLVRLQQILKERSKQALPAKEEEEEGSGAREEEERILGDFSTETSEIIEALEGVVADAYGETAASFNIYSCPSAFSRQSHRVTTSCLLYIGLPSLEPDLRPHMHSLQEQFEIRSIETTMENGTSR